MKKVSNRIALIIGLIMSFYSVSAQKTSSLYDYQFSLDSLEGGQIDFSKFKGKKVLFVNVASKCGYVRNRLNFQTSFQLK